MPGPAANVKNAKQYEAPKDQGVAEERAAEFANTEDASRKSGQESGKGGTTAQQKRAGSKSGKAAAKKS